MKAIRLESADQVAELPRVTSVRPLPSVFITNKSDVWIGSVGARLRLLSKTIFLSSGDRFAKASRSMLCVARRGLVPSGFDQIDLRNAEELGLGTAQGQSRVLVSAIVDSDESRPPRRPTPPDPRPPRHTSTQAPSRSLAGHDHSPAMRIGWTGKRHARLFMVDASDR